MQTFNIHEAKTNLSKLIDNAVKGKPFIIAKAGKPLVKVIALNTPETGAPNRIGFMAREIKVPPDFDQMGATEIAGLFEGDK